MLGDGGGEGWGGGGGGDGEREGWGGGGGGDGEREGGGGSSLYDRHSNKWLVLLVWMLPRKGSGAAGSSHIKCLVNISMVTSVTNQMLSLP